MTEIAQICERYGLKQTELAKKFGIPLRTVQDWHGGRRPAPEYVVNMIDRLLSLEQTRKTTVEQANYINNNVIKSTTHLEYMALVKLPNGNWRKIHPFFYKSAETAERVIQEHKKANSQSTEAEYKVLAYKVRITKEEV
jgi:putative transcriptional regulator